MSNSADAHHVNAGDAHQPPDAVVDTGRRYSILWLLLIAEIALGLLLGVQATASPQTNDADAYAREALQFASGDGSWLSGVHNYLYPAFLAVLNELGLWGTIGASAGDGRLGVGIVQLTLLYTASFALMAVLSRCLRMPLASVGVVICGLAILPAAAWSGYWLSESLAAPVLLVVIALWVLTCYGVLLRPAATSTIATICGLGLATGFAWMTRPALVWVPVVIGLLAGSMILAFMASRHLQRQDSGVQPPSYLRAMSLIAVFFLGAAFALVPQLAFDAHIGHLLKLHLAGAQAEGASTVWRYATNLSGCGPRNLGFSPLSSDMGPIVSRQVVAPDSALWGLTSIAAHLVSGWDPLPSPNYATSLTTSPWITVTLVSGFVVAAPVLASAWVVTEIRPLLNGGRLGARTADISRFAFAASLAGLLVFFGVAQFALLRSATEFRFNLMGWLSAGTCLVFLIASSPLSRMRLLRYAAVGVTLSAVILVIGQMTLDYSAYWLQCSK